MHLPNPSGKTLHEQLFDPRLFRLQLRRSISQETKQDYAGQAPNLFVGRFGYPQVRIGLLNTEHYHEHDEPLKWSRENTSIQDIISLRSSLVNAGGQTHVKPFHGPTSARLLELGQEVAMAVRPVDLDIALDKKPSFRLQLHEHSLPEGPQAALKRASLTSNPKIPRMIDRVVSDDDLKAGSGMNSLWRQGLGEHHLTKLLTAGTLGTKLERRLVPTRWGITAVDDTVGKSMMRQIQDHAEIDCKAYYGSHLGNHFLILTFPQFWSYELFENAVGDGSTLSTEYTDHEGFKGRKTYASKTAGGYYASRLGVLERLSEDRRKGGVLALRFITKDYWAPLGVWVVREAVRKAMANPSPTFGDETLLLRYAKTFAQRKFGIDISPLLEASVLLRERRSQTRLTQF